jgi:hypothetical protein
MQPLSGDDACNVAPKEACRGGVSYSDQLNDAING